MPIMSDRNKGTRALVTGGAAAVLHVKIVSARPSDRVGVIEGKVVGYDIVPSNRSAPQQTVTVPD